MQLGAVGKDGKRGGRVEREVESWEGNVRGKRAGYREKVKARQSTGTNGDTTLGTVGEDIEGAEEEEEEEAREHDSKRLRFDEEGQQREGSATGEISRSTQNLRLSVNHRRKLESTEDEDAEEDLDDDESDEQDEDDGDDAQDQEAPDMEDTLEQDDPGETRGKGSLAPNGRVEVNGSDDDSD